MSPPSQAGQLPQGIGGAKVVLAILGSMAVVTISVLVAFALFRPEAAPCAEGELSTNALLPDGRYEVRTVEFESVRDAGAFICKRTPELHAGEWSLAHISATRTVPIARLVEGRGIGFVTLEYTQDETGRPLTVETAPYFGPSYFERELPAEVTAEAVEVNGQPGHVYRYGINPHFVSLIWRDDTLEHRVVVQLTPEFEVEQLLGVVETLR